MTAPLKPTGSPQMQQYSADFRAYEIAVVEWLGIDPTATMRLDEQKVPQAAEFGFPVPPSLRFTWQTLDRTQVADGHLGRYVLPLGARGGSDEPTVFTLGVELDWREVERLRTEVGERPEFPMSVADRGALERFAGTAVPRRSSMPCSKTTDHDEHDYDISIDGNPLRVHCPGGPA